MRRKISNFQFPISNNGFTLVELLVVMAILGILTVITLGNFRTSQIKARDAQRKSDLRQIANALEAYYNDHSVYPSSNASGFILACFCSNGNEPCDWTQDLGQREFCDENNTVYMSKVPGDPLSDPEHAYCYESDETYYKLYAILENKNDPEAKIEVTCAGREYNFGISSSNVPLVVEEEE